jgi:hypothetical protein
MVHSAMGEMDVTFRRMLRDVPQPILQLAFPGRQLEVFGPPLDPSLDRPRQRTGDNLLRVRDGDSEAVVHVEFEREWRPEIPRRLFEYASAAVLATKVAVSSIVVLLKRGGQPPRGTGVHRIPDIDGTTFVFRYHVVPLWQLEAREMKSQLGLTGAPFCVAMHGADEELVQELAGEVNRDEGLSTEDRETTMKLLYFVTAAILGIDAARRIFNMEWLINDPNVQQLIREWKDEGHVEATRSHLYKVLALRSLPVTPDVRARIDGEHDIARLEAWHAAAVTAGTIGDVFRDG